MNTITIEELADKLGWSHEYAKKLLIIAKEKQEKQQHIKGNKLIYIGKWLPDEPGTPFIVNKVIKRITHLLADDLTDDEIKLWWQEICNYNSHNPYDVKITIIEFR
jgi:hypothetical protein